MDTLPLPRERAAEPGPMVPAPFVVIDTRRDTEDTWTLEMQPVSGDSFSFAPGQFTMISAGCGEVPISISGDPDQPGRLRQTVRRVGLATAALCDARPGQVLAVRGPFGSAWPVEAAMSGDVVVAAGGLGLPPLRPAILHMLARRERYRRLILLYGSRSPEQILFRGELDVWADRGLEVHVTVDSAGPEWLGHVGVITRLVAPAAIDPATTTALVCGPEVMIRFLATRLADEGLPPERTHVSLERNMQCGIGHCGHCQLGPLLLCRDGPVVGWADAAPWLRVREL